MKITLVVLDLKMWNILHNYFSLFLRIKTMIESVFISSRYLLYGSVVAFEPDAGVGDVELLVLAGGGVVPLPLQPRVLGAHLRLGRHAAHRSRHEAGRDLPHQALVSDM